MSSTLTNIESATSTAQFVGSQIAKAIGGVPAQAVTAYLMGEASWTASVMDLTEKLQNGTATGIDVAQVLSKTATVLAGFGVLAGLANPWTLTAAGLGGLVVLVADNYPEQGMDQFLKQLPKDFIKFGKGFGDTINGFEKSITEKIQAINNTLRDPATYRIVYYDPLVLDLNSNGIETVTSNGMSGALFDLNNDGIRTATGWVGSNDGILVRDVNGNGTIDNGTEVFGDSTNVANGLTANNGFTALANLDSNGDGVVDAADTHFAQLQVWRDLNQNGISDAGELFTLQSLGIQSLNTAITSTPNAALAGGIQAQTGSFTRTDGSTSTMADINLTQDTWHSRYINQIVVPAALQHLPNISSMGRLRAGNDESFDIRKKEYLGGV